MAGEEGSVFAALVEVDEGRLSKETVQITTLAVNGDKEWPDQPFLCQVSESWALLYFDSRNSMWYCDVAGRKLTMRKLRTTMPAHWGFRALPIYLSNQKLLVAGAYPESADITLIS